LWLGIRGSVHLWAIFYIIEFVEKGISNKFEWIKYCKKIDQNIDPQPQTSGMLRKCGVVQQKQSPLCLSIPLCLFLFWVLLSVSFINVHRRTARNSATIEPTYTNLQRLVLGPFPSQIWCMSSFWEIITVSAIIHLWNYMKTILYYVFKNVQ
jgi:hypothetical protein